jgi:hypothetical protein
VATSTFGGGGGTKVFCSQALNMVNADMTNAIREAVAASCKREDLMPVPQLIFVSRKRCLSKCNLFQNQDACRRGFLWHLDSNNPLAVEPETENDAARASCSGNKPGDLRS